MSYSCNNELDPYQLGNIVFLSSSTMFFSAIGKPYTLMTPMLINSYNESPLEIYNFVHHAM
jgi:hypothetical protein